MTPAPLVGQPVFAWRLDQEIFATSWNSGIGAGKAGGRWNAVSKNIVYASLDPATTVLEKAVHVGFPTLDIVPHVITKFVINDAALVEIVLPTQIPNPHWLRPCAPNSNQQIFLESRLTNRTKPFVLIPSAVSPESWNVLFDPDIAAGHYAFVAQERFALDPRLSP